MQVTYRDRNGWESKKIWRYDESHEITCSKATGIKISEEDKNGATQIPSMIATGDPANSEVQRKCSTKDTLRRI